MHWTDWVAKHKLERMVRNIEVLLRNECTVDTLDEYALSMSHIIVIVMQELDCLELVKELKDQTTCIQGGGEESIFGTLEKLSLEDRAQMVIEWRRKARYRIP